MNKKQVAALIIFSLVCSGLLPTIIFFLIFPPKLSGKSYSLFDKRYPVDNFNMDTREESIQQILLIQAVVFEPPKKRLFELESLHIEYTPLDFSFISPTSTN